MCCNELFQRVEIRVDIYCTKSHYICMLYWAFPMCRNQSSFEITVVFETCLRIMNYKSYLITSDYLLKEVLKRQMDSTFVHIVEVWSSGVACHVIWTAEEACRTEAYDWCWCVHVWRVHMWRNCCTMTLLIWCILHALFAHTWIFAVC